MRIGIRIAIYDDTDLELVARSVWLPADATDLNEWRPTYDTICAALWELIPTIQREAGAHRAVSL